MKIPLGRHLKIIWLAIRKPYLFGPAVTLHRAIIKGEEECETQYFHKDGRKRTLNYRIVATKLKEKTTWT